MILLTAVIIGLAAGVIRARIGRRAYQLPDLRLEWLVLLAFVPQIIAFHIPGINTQFPDEWIPVALIGSQIGLLVFVWFNRTRAGLLLLGVGLCLNFLVICLNGGYMPISPETVQWLLPDAPQGSWQVGHRLGTSKDIVTMVETTRLWFLSDMLRLTVSPNYRVAYSLGDVFISLGAFWLLWSLGGAQVFNKHKVRSYEKSNLTKFVASVNGRDDQVSRVQQDSHRGSD